MKIMAPERLTNFGDLSWGEAGADHIARYLFAAGFARGKRVLDVGTGLGYGAAILRASGAAAVAALDIDPNSIAKARSLFAENGVEYFVGDSQTFDADGRQYDLICSFENIEHIPDPAAFVRAARNSLAGDGVLICSTPAREVTPPFVNGRPANPYHVNEWYRDEFVELLRPMFGDRIEMYAQVESFALLQRRAATESLIRILRHPMRASTMHTLTRGGLWIADRIGLRGVRRSVGMTGDISGVACPSPGDFPIVHASLEPLFGKRFAHVAVCRRGA
jgi:SAM-dependent methyltransferase